MMVVKKDNNIEFLRFIATVGVVFVHIGICWISSFWKTASPLQNFQFSTIQHCMFWAVPVFMMITGSLMMQKKEITYHTAFKYFKRIAVLLILFGTVFSWMELYFKDHEVSSTLIWGGILNVLEGNTWKHLWYLYMLLGIYLVLPVLNGMNKMPMKEIGLMTVVILVFNSLLPTFQLECGIAFPIASIYVGYFLMGYLVLKTNDCSFMKGKTLIALAILLFTFILLVGYRYLSIVKGERIWVDCSSYFSAFTVLQSAIVFWLLTKKKGYFDKFCSMWLIRRFNRCSLGIYIIHMLWINLIIKVFHINIMPYGIWGIIPMGMMVFLLAWVTTEGMIRLPILRRYL